ncbi:MAG: TetR/AcrR family transcriptional regulator [Oscillospiraceae bacterium]|jgi:AcrR family transcriptional regulator|nr:TetR/AcrR family transcriptional regulator [Oscillospiraceae bacterium]
MAPKVKITRDMIIDAAFEIVRTRGAEHINARSVAEKLNCSTQPIMYHFSKIKELKRAAYEKADEFHSAYLLDFSGKVGEPMQQIGLQYIRFAAEEKQLFRFLFQSGAFAGKTLDELINAEELEPVLAIMQKNANADRKQTQLIFQSVFLVAHGYAGLLANNAMDYNEAYIVSFLKRAYIGAIYATNKEISNEKTI